MSFKELRVEVTYKNADGVKVTVTAIPDCAFVKIDKKYNTIEDIVFLENKLSSGTDLTKNQRILMEALRDGKGKVTIKKKEFNTDKRKFYKE